MKREIFKLSQVLGAVLFAFSAQPTFSASLNNDVWGGQVSGYTGDNYLALGAGSTAGDLGTSIGYASSAGTWSVAVGQASRATAQGAVSVGQSTTASGDRSTAIGRQASATSSGSIALGTSSSAARAAGSFGTSSDGTELTEAVSFGNVEKTGAVWTSTHGVTSIGSDTLSRQLTGVAAGSQDNDAVNVAQLKSLQQSSLFGAGVSNLDINGAAVQGGAALGDNSQVQVNGGVAIGLNSVASNEGRTAPVYLKTDSTTGGAWQTDENHGLVSFGGSYEATVTADDGSQSTQTVNFNRQITGVAAGSEDNDAVNVAQLKEVNNQVQGLVTGDTKVSTIQLTATDENGQPVDTTQTIGLRYQVASSEPVVQADGDPVTPATSQGRLVYNNLDARGNYLGTETIATLSDGIKLSGGTTTGADGTTVDSVNVNLNQGISFLGDEYLQTTVTAGENGGAVVTVGASQALKDFLANSGVQPSDPSNPSNPGGGSTGGTWTPNAAQQAALNGNFANGITVAAGEGNQAIQIKQGNVDMGGNRIQNVGNPINDGDAANKAYVDSTSRSLRNKINDVDKDLRAGVAMAMAVGNLPQAYMPGKSILAVSAGTYHGQGGFALGLSHATDNRQWVFKGAASVDTRGNFGGTLSAGYQF